MIVEQRTVVSDDTLSDEVLMAAAQAGDPIAFESLRNRHLSRIHRLCWILLGSSLEAEDATQEAFVRAFLHRQSFRPGKPFAPWLTRIARNVCIDHLRHTRFTADWDAEEMTHIPACEPSPERLMLDAEERAALRACFSRLNTEERAILSGFYVSDEGLRQVVITGLIRCLRLSRRTIYERHKRALGKLKACLIAKGVVEGC